MDEAVVTVVVLLLIYFVPTIITCFNGHPYAMGIFFLNLFLGWTILGWVAALIWSVSVPGKNKPKDDSHEVESEMFDK